MTNAIRAVRTSRQLEISVPNDGSSPAVMIAATTSPAPRRRVARAAAIQPAHRSAATRCPAMLSYRSATTRESRKPGYATSRMSTRTPATRDADLEEVRDGGGRLLQIAEDRRARDTRPRTQGRRLASAEGVGPLTAPSGCDTRSSDRSPIGIRTARNPGPTSAHPCVTSAWLDCRTTRSRRRLHRAPQLQSDVNSPLRLLLYAPSRASVVEDAVRAGVRHPRIE